MEESARSKRAEAEAYWLKKLEALKRERAKLPPPPPPPVVALDLVQSSRGNKGLGVDLICNSCRQHIPKSQNLKTFCQLFRIPDGSRKAGPPPLSRWFARCPSCNQCFRLVRNSRKFIYVSGAELSEHQDDGGDLDAVNEIYDLDWNDGYDEAMFSIHSDVLALVDSPSGVPLTLPPRDENIIELAIAAHGYRCAKYHGKFGGKWGI